MRNLHDLLFFLGNKIISHCCNTVCGEQRTVYPQVNYLKKEENN